jgi:hypothetical protein
LLAEKQISIFNAKIRRISQPPPPVRLPLRRIDDPLLIELMTVVEVGIKPALPVGARG